MCEKRFKLDKDTEWWFVNDNTIEVNEYGYREDLIGEDVYRGLRQQLTEQEVVDLLNEQDAKIKELTEKLAELKRIDGWKTIALCDFHNKELAEWKWGDKRPEFHIDKYYEICMEELKAEKEKREQNRP